MWMFRILFVVLASCAWLRADSYLASHPETFTSPSGKYIVRIEAADSVVRKHLFWHHTEFTVFAYDEKTESFERIRKFEVEGHPLQLFINDAGTHIVTVDQHFGAGKGQIAAVYDFQGTLLARWDLTDLFEEMKTDVHSFSKFRRTTSSVAWRGAASWDYDQKKILIQAPKDIEDRKDGTWVTTYPSKEDSYEIDVEAVTMKRIPPRIRTEETSGPDQESGKKVK